MTSFPTDLQNALESLLSSFKVQELSLARQVLSNRYRDPKFDKQFMTQDSHHYAYIASRMPATFAAICRAFEMIKNSQQKIKSVIDLGSGPGTAMWALNEYYPEVEKYILIERDAALISIGKKLASFSKNPIIRAANWQQANLEQPLSLPKCDLVIMSYSIGELEPKYFDLLIEQCLKSASQLLVIIEPGTPIGFERIRILRQNMIDRGAFLVAPCPHALACPIINPDWCHFTARVERTSLHRKIKQGSLGHEDEKFSFVAVCPNAVILSDNRILRHPERHSGHIRLKLCTNEGIQNTLISKKQGEMYKKARKLEWGDCLEQEMINS